MRQHKWLGQVLKLEGVGARIDGKRLNNLRFADYIGLIIETLEHSQALLDCEDREVTRLGQEISETKTE